MPGLQLSHLAIDCQRGGYVGEGEESIECLVIQIPLDNARREDSLYFRTEQQRTVNLGIGVGLETMSLLLERGAQLAVVVDLAVEDYPDRRIFVVNRLTAATQIDDAQTPHRQSGPWFPKDAAIVGSTPRERAIHALKSFVGDSGAIPEVSTYAAH